MIQILPSILSADFNNLGREIETVARAGAHGIHVDVMDGHFVPNITIGPPVIQCLKSATRLPLDVHLMISDADRYIPNFIKSGADRLSVHVEACTHLHSTLVKIKSAGVKCGVALNPATPLGQIVEILHLVDFILIMSVNPGFSGQAFIPEAIDKISRLYNVIQSRNLKAIISVDGGVSIENASTLVKAGARMLVAGNAVFGADDPGKALKELAAAAKITRRII